MNLADRFSEWFQLASRDVFEPALNWVLQHPFLSVGAVFVVIFFSVRNYRML
ncbi:MAG: hypothetical protein ACTHMB_07150 [Candidatus Binatia bacterium]|jgi:hypothetical protein